MSNEVRKDNTILKGLETWRLFIINCVLPWKNHLVIDAFFYLRMSEEQSHNSRSKVPFDLEKLTAETFVVFFYNIDEM